MKFKIKLIAIFLVLLGCCINLKAQIAYHDAFELSGLTSKYKIEENGPIIQFILDPNSDLEIFKILALYDKDLSKQSTVQNVIDAYISSKNPFISISISDTAISLDSMQLGDLPKISRSNASGIFDIPTIVGGLAKFFVERFKEELSAAFFQKFKDEITKDKYKIYKNLFPETFKMLDTIDKEIYNFSSYIQILREAFDKDLNNIYENLPAAFIGLMEVDKIRDFFEQKQNKWLKAILDSGFYIIKYLKENKHPGDILNDFSTQILLEGDSQNSKNLGNAIELLKIISNSLREKSGDRYWINKDELNKLFGKGNGNYVVYKIYLGLIYQKAKAIQFKVKTNTSDTIIDFKDVLISLKKPINQIEDVYYKIDGFMYRVELIEAYLNELKDMIQKDKKPTFNDYFKFYTASLDTLEYSLQFLEYSLEKKMPRDEESLKSKIDSISEVKKYLGVARAVGDIYMDINKKNYSSIVFNVIKILDNVIAPASKEDSLKLRAGILKYGSFMAALANAQNSNEVKSAIQAVVLPAGSSSIKRNSSFNLSINAYLGASVFREEKANEDENSDTTRHYIGKARVWAPIGIACSLGKINFPGKECAFIKSVTLFASIIDIGAVTAFQFRNELESDEKIPKFTFKNIVSPGLHAVLGIKNLPISFGVGCQRLPQLREITITTSEGNEIITETKIVTDNLWKWNFFIAVDIPLLNFVTK